MSFFWSYFTVSFSSNLDANVDLFLLRKNNDGIPVLKLGTEKQIGMMIKIKNALPGEDAHQAELKMVLPDVLEYRGVEKTAGVSLDPNTGTPPFFNTVWSGTYFKLEKINNERLPSTLLLNQMFKLTLITDACY